MTHPVKNVKSPLQKMFAQDMIVICISKRGSSFKPLDFIFRFFSLFLWTMKASQSVFLFSIYIFLNKTF